MKFLIVLGAGVTLMIFIFWGIFPGVDSCSQTPAGSDLDPVNLVKVSDEKLYSESTQDTCLLKIIRPKKKDKEIEMIVKKKGKNKKLVRFLNPPKDRGTAFLLNGDNMWVYLPSIEKSIRISAKQNFSGSDFSNGDILRTNLVEDYVPTLLGEEKIEGVSAYKLELKGKNASVAYDKIVIWIEKTTFFPVQRDFYTLSGTKLKSLTFSAPQKVGDHTRPTVLTMTSIMEKNTYTSLTLTKVKDNVTFEDQIFSQSYLERGR